MQTAKKQLHLMGTNISLMLVHPKAQDLIHDLTGQLFDYNQIFSANDSNSWLSQVNQAAGKQAVKVPKLLFDLIAVGKDHSLAKDSYLNIAIGPLVKLWRIGFEDARLPSDSEIKTKLALIDPDNIHLDSDQSTVFLTQPGMEIDLGALAKGYITDLLADYLKQAGIASGLINLGGNLIPIGPALNRPDYYWRIGIQRPGSARGQSLAKIKIYNQSVVTSGIYERMMTYEGVTYHHIFDSQTGYPIRNDLASLTVVADRSLEAEIWTSRLFGYQAKEAIQLIEGQPQLEGIVVDKSLQLYQSSGIVNG